MALRLLSRSAAALVAQQLGPAAQRLPSDWNPFASLAGETEVCSPLARRHCSVRRRIASRRPDAEGCL